jgi:hypothetical protein
MTSNPQSPHSPSDHQVDKQKAKTDIWFENGEVHLVVQQPARAADQEWYNAAQIQCQQRMIASPPTTFDCEISGRMSAPRTEVILRRAMVEKAAIAAGRHQEHNHTTGGYPT